MKFFTIFLQTFFILFSIYIKISNNLSSKYYQENKERLQKKACEIHQNLSDEEKEKQRHYGQDRNQNLSEDEEQKLFEYRKNIIEEEKTLY